jgi:hypothetical protein
MPEKVALLCEKLVTVEESEAITWPKFVILPCSRQSIAKRFVAHARVHGEFAAYEHTAVYIGTLIHADQVIGVYPIVLGLKPELDQVVVTDMDIFD